MFRPRRASSQSVAEASRLPASKKRTSSHSVNLGKMLILLAIIAVVLLVTTTHLRKTSDRKDRAMSSIALFFITWILVGVSGMHMCQEGRSPSYLAFVFAFLASSMPWQRGLHPWTIRALIAVVFGSGISSSSYLASSYHQKEITGNPDYASARFWHTALTGQYPRDKAKMERKRMRDFPLTEKNDQTR